MKKNNNKFLRVLATVGTTTLTCLTFFMIGGHVSRSQQDNSEYIINPDSIGVYFEAPNGPISAYYNPNTDKIGIRRSSDKTISHELKHAQNATLFNKGLSVCADEISARCAEMLSVSEAKFINYIPSKFCYEDRRPRMVARDENYYIPIINQEIIDLVILAGLEEWDAEKSGYMGYRLTSFSQRAFTSLSDADLEKLFTFKINGVHRCLFKECSSDVRRELRNACNSGSIAYLVKKPFMHTR